MKRIRDLIPLDRPIAIWLEEADDLPGTWIARITGLQLDNITQGAPGGGPISALESAADLLRMLAGVCPDPRGHDFSVKTTFDGYDDDNVLLFEGGPAIGCSRCPERAHADALEEVPEEV